MQNISLSYPILYFKLTFQSICDHDFLFQFLFSLIALLEYFLVLKDFVIAIIFLNFFVLDVTYLS